MGSKGSMIPLDHILKLNIYNLIGLLHSLLQQQLSLYGIKYLILAEIPQSFNIISNLTNNLQSICILKLITPNRLFEIFLSQQWVEHHIQEYFHQIPVVMKKSSLICIEYVIICYIPEVLRVKGAPCHKLYWVTYGVLFGSAVQKFL